WGWALFPARPAIEWRDLPDPFYVSEVIPTGPTIVLRPSRDCGNIPPRGPVVLLGAGAGSRRQLMEHKYLHGFRASPDAKWILTNDSDGLKVTGVESADALTLEGSDPATWGTPLKAATFSRGGELLAYGGHLGGRSAVRIFDLRSRRPVGLVVDEDSPLAVDSERRQVVCVARVGDRAECRVIDWSDGSIQRRLPVRDLGVAPLGHRLIYTEAGGEGRVHCIGFAKGDTDWEIPGGAPSNVQGQEQFLFIEEGGGSKPLIVSVRDAHDGRLLGRCRMAPGERLINFDHWASPTDAAVAVQSDEPRDRVGELLEKWVPALGVRAAPGRICLVDVVTGATKCVLPGGDSDAFFLPDGRLAVKRGTTIQVWDVPPRKSVTWFAAAAGLLALPLAAWAGWRSRRLQPKAA
ncbi:MAG TPA: hypothetical protein VH120_10395, partial [Gemmataceae bacterium]|nr:hypothetical protein [Gemmataceae bacterium]